MTARLFTHALFGAFAGFWISRAVFKWILDVDGTHLLVLIGAAMLAGVIFGVAAERESRPDSE